MKRPTGAGLRRRELLLAAGLAPCLPALGATPSGPVDPPAFAPELPLTDQQGRHTSLPALLRGQVAVVQLMFTGCSSVCPTQGLLFAQLAPRPRPFEVRWLSISIDALGDDAPRLAAWQARFGAHPAWHAAVPRPQDVDRLGEWLRGAAVRPGTHGTQVFVFDAAARLCRRSAENPSPAEVERLLAQAAAAAQAQARGGAIDA